MGSLDDFEVDATIELDPRRREDRSNRSRGPTVASDDFAQIVRRDAQLVECTVFVIELVHGNLDLIGPIDERLGNQFDKFFHRSALGPV